MGKKIKSVLAREILDSRGQPTVEVSLSLEGGLEASASVPSGTSVGLYEAKELRDGDTRRYFGQGVLKAVAKVNEEIAPKLIGQDVFLQAEIDRQLIELDGSPDKRRLGANSVLAASLACARAGAKASGQELFSYLASAYGFAAPGRLPVPIFNIFNGGVHADTNLDFQEFHVIPKRQSVAEMVRLGAEIFARLGRELRSAGYDSDVGTEGGYAPDIDSSLEAIELILAAASRTGYKAGEDFWLGVDVGASLLYDQEKRRYVFPLDRAFFSADNLIGLYSEWLKKYPFLYIEDGLDQDAWEDWRTLTAELGGKLVLAGDDFFATNPERLSRGLSEKAANAIIIKPNQAGTLSEAVDCLKLAQKHGYKIIVSHRSGETNDDFIADLAVAASADYLKAGSLSRGERLAKYNRLMAIELMLGGKK